MKVFRQLFWLASVVIVLAQPCKAQQILPIASGLPVGIQVGGTVRKAHHQEDAMVHDWKQYAKAFEYADYPQYADHFTFQATLIDASGQAVTATDRGSLINWCQKIRENIEDR